MAKRFFLLLHAALAAFSCAAAEKPNVLLVMTDDQGYGDFSLHGNPDLETPHLDRFASEGIRFTQFQVSPFCAPTRASLLTGRYSLRTGTVGVTTNRETMRSSEITLAEALRTVGYRSACIGKWHNGEQFPVDAIGQGFDEFFGFEGGHWNDYFDPVLVRGHESVATEGYITDLLVDEAIRFMEETKGPFFCYLPLNAPHTPSQAPRHYFDRYKSKGLDDETAAIFAMCASIDDNFGRLIAHLDESGKRDNTIVLFLTDNGANTDRFNAGMRGRKVSVHEGGTRVPLFVQWPARWEGGRTVEQLAAHIDLYPTLVRLCGATPPVGPPIDGIDLTPWLDGERVDRSDRRIFIYNGQSLPPSRFGGAVRTDRFRAVCEDRKADFPDAKWQLYDLESDPGQEKDISGAEPELLDELASAYESWWREASAGADSLARIEIGHREEPSVRLHVPQAFRQVGMEFHTRAISGRDSAFGFANDFLVSWNDEGDSVNWAVQIVEAGSYHVELVCNVPEAAGQPKVRVECAGSAIEGKLTRSFPGEQIELDHLVEEEHSKYVNRSWTTLPVGEIDLPTGSAELVVRAEDFADGASLSLKEVVLTRVEGSPK